MAKVMAYTVPKHDQNGDKYMKVCNIQSEITSEIEHGNDRSFTAGIVGCIYYTCIPYTYCLNSGMFSSALISET